MTILESDQSERRALAVFAIAAVAAMIWIVRPVALGILLGTLLGFSLQGAYERSVRRHGRPELSALIFVFASLLGLLALMMGLFSLIISRGIVLTQAFVATLGPEGQLYARVERIATHIPWLHLGRNELATDVREAVASIASRAAHMATVVAMTSYHGVITLFFAMMTLAFVLRNWSRIERHVEDMLPLHQRHTRALLAEFQRVGRTTLLGTVLTGISQGVFAFLGYWITGVPEAAFFGAATALASLVPGVGTMLIWIPAAGFLFYTGHPAMGILELCWASVFVIGVSDYVIRPRLVGSGSEMPALLTFASLFGGVEVFGLAGLLIGPLTMSVSYAVLRIFALDAAERRE